MIAAVDCGTNTIKLLIADEAGADVVRESRVVRLGEGVDSTGRLGAAALARTLAAVEEYAALIAAHPVTALRFCATSATRDASNGADFGDAVEALLGVRPEVISGDEEARLAFSGAVEQLAVTPDRPLLVIDIGGGSTELILGGADGPTAACSLDIGSVRLTERHLAGDPPAVTELDTCRAAIDEQLDGSPVPLDQARTVVGVAGTITTVAAGVLGLDGYDRAAIDQAEIPVAAAASYVAWLAGTTATERAALPYLHPGRVDVIVAGALILERVLLRTEVETMVVSEFDILDGIAHSLR